MRVELVPQVQVGCIQRMRVGDILNSSIAATGCDRFQFAVAYMRLSGWDRIAGAVDSLVNRGGRVSGVIGVDSRVTTVEALQALQRVSQNSTIFYTTSDFIFHPKLYLMAGDASALAIVGSPNLTRDGLFRNIEVATAVHMDLASNTDVQVFNRYEALLNELLDPGQANVQPINEVTVRTLLDARVLQHETSTRDLGGSIAGRTSRSNQNLQDLEDLFPRMRIPVAPAPTRGTIRAPTPRLPPIIPPQTVETSGTFVMQLSAFDCSHRSGVAGTPEVLIPHPAVAFFPPISSGGRRYPDTMFDVVLNTLTGQERHKYRLWYYEMRATGTRIDEYRLRMDHDTIDLTSPGGGDLLIITKLSQGSEPAYEVTILPQTDPTFPGFFSLCENEAQGKLWGIASMGNETTP